MADQSSDTLSSSTPRGDLVGRVALITGAASGIGLAISKRFAREGARIALFDFNVERLQKACDEIARLTSADQVLPVPCDITNEESVISAVLTTVSHFGQLNVAVNNAGVSKSVPSDECTLADWKWIMDVNATGSFLVSREAIKVFKKQKDGGALVYINSDDSLKPSRHFLAYNASKAAQLHMARTIANEFGPYKIRANSILPGAVFGGSGIWTPEMRAARAKIHGFHPDQLEEEYKKNNALGVIIDPAEIAELAVFLASDRSAKMTGAALVIDGGGLGGFVR
jgi:NAD(P)-dependent dehydrogenase (short-subunit alcohol dehydrogenase family)